MDKRTQRRSQASLVRGAEDDKPLSSDTAPGEDRCSDFPFFYANCCFAFFPADPVDFHAFAQGQLMVMAILVPAVAAMFIFLAA